ncbi:glycosyl transferase family 17 protein [Dissophora ornata]|nr:hypothetical protein BGZ58_010980 [Dissophora ornata]KAI8604408.1 glycosyl transferase family 17 protein [Dissophora ornata]
MGARIFRRRPRIMMLFSGFIGIFVVLSIFPYLLVDLGYLVRPIWDKRQDPFNKVLVHHYAEGMSMQERCEAHGWTLAPQDSTPPQVYDAVIFSVELDMLEIRIQELWDVVDKFVIVESNATFTGLPKDAVFWDNRDRFSFAESKIVYKLLPLYPLGPEESAWINEGRMRDGMTDFLTEAGVQAGDLVTSLDADELVSQHTIELLKSCHGVPESIHVQLKNYLYSFEFPVNDGGNYQASVHKWWPGYSRYVHHLQADVLLTDAGWHCSFCFRTIEEFQFKMQAYSHSDRVRYNYLMDLEWIQHAICEGKDLFGMLPEAYSFQELFSRIGAIPKSIFAVGLPKWVLANRQRFKFLLPGGCERQGPL